MGRLLVIGMFGADKSTLLAELAPRGHRTVDTDYGVRMDGIIASRTE